MSDDDHISKLASLQYVWKNEGYRLNSRQNRAAQDGDEFLANLKQLLGVDLGLYAQGRSELDEQLGHWLFSFHRGAVLARHFGKDPADSVLAGNILDALAREVIPQKSAANQQGIPIELKQPCWYSLYCSWKQPSQLADSTAEGESEISFAEVCIFLQKCGSTERATERRLLGLLTLVGNHFSTEMANRIAYQLREISTHDRPLVQLLVDERLLRLIWEQYGVGGVAELLESIALISQRCSEPLLGQFLSQLCKQVETAKEFVRVLIGLRRLAEHEGVAPETLELLTKSPRMDKLQLLLELGTTARERILSIDAQRVMIAMMSKYKLKHPDQTESLCRKLSNIGLDPEIRRRLIKQLTEKPEFATQFIRRKMDTKALITKYEDCVSTDRRFYYLTLLACQSFEGHVLGSITRGLSILLRLKRDSLIDDSHYRLLMTDLTGCLPDSLMRLHDQPADMDLKLRQLYLPLTVAGELLHSRESIPYLSDFYYDLRRRDREAHLEP